MDILLPTTKPDIGKWRIRVVAERLDLYGNPDGSPRFETVVSDTPAIGLNQVHMQMVLHAQPNLTKPDHKCRNGESEKKACAHNCANCTKHAPSATHQTT